MPRSSEARTPLSPERVVDAALGILRSDGLDALTVRGLAGKLGVAVTAIYWHVGDKQALLDAVIDRIVSELGEVRVTGKDPATRLVSIGTSLHANLLSQGHLVAVVHQQGRTAELFHPAQRIVAKELAAVGMHGEDAARALHAFLRFVSGAVVLERSVERAPLQRETPEELWARDEVPNDPELTAALTHPVDPDDVFAFSLTTFVRGLLE